MTSGRRREHLLEVVEHQQQPAVSQIGLDGRHEVGPGRSVIPSASATPTTTAVDVMGVLERDERRTVSARSGRDRDRHPRLAAAPRAGERDQTMLAEQSLDLPDVGLPADEGSQGDRQSSASCYAIHRGGECTADTA